MKESKSLIEKVKSSKIICQNINATKKKFQALVKNVIVSDPSAGVNEEDSIERKNNYPQKDSIPKFEENQFLKEYRISTLKDFEKTNTFIKKKESLQDMFMKDPILHIDELFEISTLKMLFGGNNAKSQQNEKKNSLLKRNYFEMTNDKIEIFSPLEKKNLHYELKSNANPYLSERSQKIILKSESFDDNIGFKFGEKCYPGDQFFSNQYEDIGIYESNHHFSKISKAESLREFEAKNTSIDENLFEFFTESKDDYIILYPKHYFKK